MEKGFENPLHKRGESISKSSAKGFQNPSPYCAPDNRQPETTQSLTALDTCQIGIRSWGSFSTAEVAEGRKALADEFMMMSLIF